MTYQFQVITKVPEPGDRGNLAWGNDIYVDPQAWGGSYQDTPKKLIEYLNLPPILGLYLWNQVFYVGEILVIGPMGSLREQGYPGRKASKWDVQYEIFDNIDDAVACAQRVMYGGNNEPEAV